MDEKKRKIFRAGMLIMFALSGAAALVYEVTWTRALSIVLGSTTYALSTMLATFMAGLALGAYAGGRAADGSRNPVLIFGLLELGIGICGLAVVPVIHRIPPLYFSLYHAFHISTSAYFFAQFLLCAGIMLVPTTLMGATFPIVSRIVTDSYEELGRGVGQAYSFNTTGAIAGSLAAGFLMIPALGVRLTSLSAAAVNLGAGLLLIFLSKTRMSRLMHLAVALVIVAAGTAALVSKEQEWLMSFYQANKYENYGQFLREVEGNVLLSDREYREGRVRLWRDRNGMLLLQVGGKIEGTGPSDISNTLLLAYLPIGHHRDPRSFLTIGLGAGVTLSAAKRHVKDVALVEINPGVVEALRRHGPPALLDGVRITVNDARNYLYLTSDHFDIISSEPSYPTEASVVGLFTREFYEIAAARLNRGGLFCQWLPYYMLSDEDITMMIRTFGSVFGHVTVWKVIDSMDLIMVGSREAFSFDEKQIKERIKELHPSGSLHFTLSRSTEDVHKIIQDGPNASLNIDDRPMLEFHAARNLLTGVRD